MPATPPSPPTACCLGAAARGLPALAVAVAVALGGCSFNLDQLPGGAGKTATEAPASPTLDALSAAIEASPHDPDLFYQRGLAYQAQNQHDHAIADFSAAIGLSARQPGALAGRAASYLATGKTFEAAADLDEAVRLSPDDAAIWTLRGQVYEKLAATTRAAGSYARALALDPDDAEAHTGFARVGGEAGKSYDPF